MSACTGCTVDFGRDYEIARSPAMLEIERLVRDTDYAATSWTTRRQAELLAARLGLAAGVRLLEIGAGAGWPGLFFAKECDCEVVLTDLPLSALRIARERADHDGIAAACSVVAASGAALPFADGCFDRVHHADVLCCMAAKREMLRECRRVARAGARMAFSVIALARTPSRDGERELLRQSGPSHPDAPGDYGTLLDEAGWTVLERTDATGEFVRCMDVLLRESQARRTQLIAMLGEQDFAERLLRRRSTQEAVRLGLLKREIFVAARA